MSQSDQLCVEFGPQEQMDDELAMRNAWGEQPFWFEATDEELDAEAAAWAAANGVEF